tara:strand:+ start:511 stop:2151 length:1641 start_codon:yes stop_codon:yes gene_type:complete
MVMIKRNTFFFVSLLSMLFALVSPSSLAANISVTVSKNKVVKNEVFQLRIVVDEKVSSDDLDLSVLEKDFYVGRPSFGTSLNIINGSRSTRSEWNISLAAQRLGTATIPSFTIDGSQSQPISIQVSMDSDEPKVSDLVALQSTINKQTLYPNESALLKTRLIIKADPRRLQNPSVIPPQAQGLTLDAIGEPNQYQSVLDGVEVTVLDQNYRVTADNSGDFTLSSIGFTGSVVYGNNRTGTTKLVSANTKPEKFSITVNPIPDNYQGAWLPASSLNLSQRWSDSDGNGIQNKTIETKVGESISRELTLDIQGVTSERFPDIKVSYPDSVRVYQEKPQFSQLDDGTTRMTVTQVLIPQQQGEIKLNDIQINWWNSQSASSAVAKLDGLTLNVAQGDLVNNSESAVFNAPQHTTETVVVKDAGFWPYLTALFAGLWLLTSVVLLKRTKQPAPSTQPQYSVQGSAKALIQAIENGDSVRSGYLAKEWISETVFQDSALREQINLELQAMQRSQYSASNDTWSSSELIALIRKAEKQNAKAKPKQSDLAQL